MEGWIGPHLNMIGWLAMGLALTWHWTLGETAKVSGWLLAKDSGVPARSGVQLA